ncbi:magnetochrome domain-containing protein [Candidatus Magnetominusculus dajiuhuensis]|uniref:magnetochrome domain-containing protein n=1 Tax=Candidatus Magnetominusculus dajiuhuensis TaxID=3137712 RepID=UPI003B43359E
MNHLWRYLNYLIIALIIGTAAYLLIFNPAKLLKRDGWEEGMIRNARQNAQSPEIVAWQKGAQSPAQGNNNTDAQAQNPNAADPYGQFYDPNAAQPGQPQPGALDTQQGVYAPQLDTANTAAPAAAISPLELILQEGHWIGLETIPLTPAIATANSIPLNVKGVLVDEVTLVAAYSGLFAGDVITAINDAEVTDLLTFRAATRPAANAKQAVVTVYRTGAQKKITVTAADVLGIAQMEAAPMILPTDTAPHGYYGPCNKCHAISKTAANTGQLAKDAGDVLTITPPPIAWGAKPPHRDRGQCTNCHKII